MATDAERSKVTVEELVARCRGELIPLSSRFSYFSTVPFAMCHRLKDLAFHSH